MCSLSVLFAYKVGLFNIGAAGQYVVGVGACLVFSSRIHTASAITTASGRPSVTNSFLEKI